MITLVSGRSRRQLWRTAVILCLLAGLAACGQKGPLYLPEPPQETSSPEQADQVSRLH